MPMAVPVRDLKDTAKFCATVQASPEPVVVTRNGYDVLVAMTPEQYHELDMARRRQQLYAEVEAAEARIDRGEGVPLREGISKIRARHGL